MRSFNFPVLSNTATSVMPFQERAGDSLTGQGAISEILYSEQNPWVTHCILLPLLQQLGSQSRWQLWLTPQQKLSRKWLEACGLPLNKVMQSRQTTAACAIESMEKALHTGNYSVVIIWLNQDLTDEEHCRLTAAAESGNTLGFIMRPQVISAARPRNGLKIHLVPYH